MARLNLTLDDSTYERLGRHARKARARRAAVARKLLVEAMDRQEAIERSRTLARAYVADRDDPDSRALLRDLEGGQLDLVPDDSP